ncbi:hypothetical protein [Saccharopolyspora endophytica]|uniref:Uncharacterized protein n=1 Tax=Saccharopolyspora endophytica TaxID=543886 RepID=A0ABS5DC49_9PSEU|nr:hypothetical protein [Saccharopolyspora endophytica]MBQ0923856.1 hypothetical protein [Saccharopolyspora endophytica]
MPPIFPERTAPPRSVITGRRRCHPAAHDVESIRRNGRRIDFTPAG